MAAFVCNKNLLRVWSIHQPSTFFFFSCNFPTARDCDDQLVDYDDLVRRIRDARIRFSKPNEETAEGQDREYDWAKLIIIIAT